MGKLFWISIGFVETLMAFLFGFFTVVLYTEPSSAPLSPAGLTPTQAQTVIMYLDIGLGVVMLLTFIFALYCFYKNKKVA